MSAGGMAADMNALRIAAIFLGISVHPGDCLAALLNDFVERYSRRQRVIYRDINHAGLIEVGGGKGE